MINLLLIVLLSLSLWATEEDCETEESNPAVKMAEELAVPNCYTKNNLYDAKQGKLDPLCKTCKTKFEKNSSKTIPEKSIDERQKVFFNSAIEEYKKLITNNLIATARLRALRPTGSSYEQSAKSCQNKTADDFLKGCGSELAKKLFKSSLILQGLQKETSSELAKILSKTNEQLPAQLLNRKPTSCFIPEKDVLLVASTNLEEAFSPQLIDFLKNLPQGKYQTIDELFVANEFISKFGDLTDFKEAITSHPLLGQYFNSPSSLSTFFKTIPQPSTPNSLRKALYNKTSGDNFDKSLAESCEKSFKTLQETICSKEFEKGDINLDAFNNHGKLYSEELTPSRKKFADSEELLQKNIQLLSLCESSSAKAKNLSKCNEIITQNLPEKYKGSSLESYKNDKFDTEIKSITESICSSDDKKCSSGSPDRETSACKAYLRYKELKKEGSLDYKLANSSNKEVNTLLRSMIGDPKNLDPKTKEILVQQGILPQEDGTLVAQAEIPERQPGYFTKETASAGAKVSPEATTTAAKTAPARQNVRPTYDSSANGFTGQPTSSFDSMPNLSDYFKNQKELADVESEIMRRLSGLPEKRPPTKEAARKIARESFQQTGRRMPPNLEDYYANRLMGDTNDRQASQNSGNADVAAGSPSTMREASVSRGDSAADKWKKDGMNRALADMHGAKQSAGGAGRDIASTNDDASSKPMTTVALNIAEDPKLSLMQSLSDKINKNDSETQLLQVLVRNKQNFILQVKSVNFKVVFDDKKQLRILLDSGDPAEAERLRPQLEIFFKRLNRL